MRKKAGLRAYLWRGVFFSLIAMAFCKCKNYDLTEYLPASARSCIGLDLMEDEFGF